MAEGAKDMAGIEQGQKGGEPIIEIDSKDNPYEAYRQGARERAEAKRAEPRTVNGEPGNPSSVRPFTDERTVPDAQGRYRDVSIVDGQLVVKPLPKKPR